MCITENIDEKQRHLFEINFVTENYFIFKYAVNITLALLIVVLCRKELMEKDLNFFIEDPHL